MQLPGIPSYRDFLLLSKKYDNADLLSNAGQYLNSLANIKSLQTKQSPVVFLVDFTTQKYVFMHKNVQHITGYTAKYFMEGGLDCYLDIWHRQDFDIYNKKVFPESMELSGRYLNELCNHIVFSRNNRVINRDGSEANFLQRYCFIIDPLYKKPVGVIGSVTDITHYTNNQQITLTVERINEDDVLSPKNLLFKKTYFDYNYDINLTKKELEILKWISEGLSSKQIADKLRLSIFTIHNHRKNMLQKTHSGNVTEVLRFAINKGLI